jgi:hypothetical protein
MMLVAFVSTLLIAAPINPDASDKKTMSGFGGIAAVWHALGARCVAQAAPP